MKTSGIKLSTPNVYSRFLKACVTLTLLLAFAGNIGCSKEEKQAAPVATTARDPVSPTTNADGTVSVSGLKLAGKVVGTEGDLFQELVQEFMSPYLVADSIGYVSSNQTDDGKTGIFIGGRVALKTGKLATNGTARTDITSNSQLVTVIWDEYAGRTDEKGNTVPPMWRPMKSSSGYVSGNSVVLKFWDSHGFVELEGQYNATYVWGEYYFENNDDPANGSVIGNFYIPVKDFFVQ